MSVRWPRLIVGTLFCAWICLLGGSAPTLSPAPAEPLRNASVVIPAAVPVSYPECPLFSKEHDRLVANCETSCEQRFLRFYSIDYESPEEASIRKRFSREQITFNRTKTICICSFLH